MEKAARKGREVKSLKDLAGLIVPLPDLPALQSVDEGSLEEQAEKIREGAKKAADWVRSALTSLRKTAGLSREALELVEENIEQTRKGLHHLLHEEKVRAYRRAAWTEVLRHSLTQELNTSDDVKALIAEMTQTGYLKETSEGAFQIGKGRYNVPDEAAFGEPETREISELIKVLSVKVLEAEKKERSRQAEEVLSESEMTFSEFRAGKAGQFAFQIPPEEVPGLNGSASYWRPGGILLIESDDEGRIWPVRGVGKETFVRAIEDARGLRVFLYRQSLEAERPPYIKALPEEHRKKVQLVWYLLQRGIRHVQKEEEILKEKNAMAQKATVSQREFFSEKKEGVCCAEYFGVWHMPENGGTIPNLFFLVERREGKIILLEVPQHVGDFLDHLIGEEAEEGEAFGGVSYPLKAILQAIYGQVEKTVQITQ